MTPVQICALFAVVIITHYIGAIAAYGSTLLALPLLVLITGDLHFSVILLLTIGSVQGIQILFYMYRYIDWKRYRVMFLFSLIGAVPGFTAGSYISKSAAFLCIGILLIISGTYRLIYSGKREYKPWHSLILFLAGFIHGAFGCGGSVLVIYANQAFKTKESFRGTLALFWVTVNMILVPIMFIRDSRFPVSAGLTAALLATVLTAGWLGQITARKISQIMFIRIVSVILVIGGLITVYRAFV